VCIEHTIVGLAPAHAAHFSTSGGGKIYQSRDTRYRSAANLNGNHRIIAIENADHGPEFRPWNVNDGHAVPSFTPAQVEAIAKILAWAHKTHGIPLVMAPNSRPGSRGVAYHRQGIDGNWAGYRYGGRVTGGEVWSSARGKVCPGDRRIAQIPQIIARAKQIAAGVTSTPPEDPVTPAEIKAIAEAVWSHDKSITQPRRAVLETAILPGKSLSTLVVAQLAELGSLKATVAELARGQALTPAQITAAAEAGARQAVDDIVDEARVELVIEDEDEPREGVQ
jgi:hypothetical protein